MPDPATSADPRRNGGESEEHAELIAEIARQKEEILRLRDLLVAKDAELGVAKGKAAELTEQSAALVVAARGLQARLPRVFRKVGGAGLRRLGGRRS